MAPEIKDNLDEWKVKEQEKLEALNEEQESSEITLTEGE